MRLIASVYQAFQEKIVKEFLFVKTNVVKMVSVIMVNAFAILAFQVLSVKVKKNVKAIATIGENAT